jgi:hypothetical protein
VKLSFFGFPGLPRLQPPLVASDNGLQIASLLDLAGTNASVVQMRAEAKDYIDIDAMLTDGRIDLPAALAKARAIYREQFNPQITLKALSYFEDGNVKTLPEAMKRRLARAASAVDLDRLPIIATDNGQGPRPGSRSLSTMKRARWPRAWCGLNRLPTRWPIRFASWRMPLRERRMSR